MSALGAGAPSAPAHLRLWKIEVAFRRPLRTGRGEIVLRHSVILRLEMAGHVGWAEAPAFPSGRFGTASDAFASLSEPSRWEAGVPTVPIAAAALQAARADAAARAAEQPLHEYLGAAGVPVPARHPIGIVDPTEIEREIAWLDSHGIGAVKLKIAPGHDTEIVAALRSELPELDIGVDANGSYTDPDSSTFSTLDELGVSFLEQPLPPGDLAGHVRLRRRTRAAICLDESADDMDAIRLAIAAEAADWIAVKLNRVGLEHLEETRSLAGSAGVGIQIGGTFDTSVGRRHLLAAAGLPGVVDAAVGPPCAYLDADVGDYPPLRHGRVAASTAPGIGIDPDEEDLDDRAIRTADVDV